MLEAINLQVWQCLVLVLSGVKGLLFVSQLLDKRAFAHRAIPLASHVRLMDRQTVIALAEIAGILGVEKRLDQVEIFEADLF